MSAMPAADRQELDRRDRARARRTRWAKTRRLRLIEGTWESSLVPAGPSRVKILQLHEQGWSLAALAAMLGESPAQITQLVYEEHHQHRRWVTRDRQERILGLVPDLQRVPDRLHVPALGTRRRVQALAVLGWSLREVADRAGVSKQALASSIGRERVTARVARVIAGIYTDLETSPGTSERVRRHAAAQGWAPPAAWDNIDDPAEHPDPALWTQDQQPGTLTLEDLQDCASWGLTREQTAHRLGVQAPSIDRWLDRHDAPGVRARFARNEITAA